MKEYNNQNRQQTKFFITDSNCSSFILEVTVTRWIEINLMIRFNAKVHKGLQTTFSKRGTISFNLAFSAFKISITVTIFYIQLTHLQSN